MCGQPGVVHRFHVRVGSETLRERQGVRGMGLHPPRESAHAAHREPTLERRWHRTDRRLDRANALRQIVVGSHDEGAAKHVAVATEVLRHGVHGEVRTQLQWSLQHRRCPSVVDDTARADAMGNLHHPGNVDDAEERIGGRFDPDQLRRRSYRAPDGGGVGHVDGGHLELPRTEQVTQQFRRAEVRIVRRDDVCPGLE